VRTYARVLIALAVVGWVLALVAAAWLHSGSKIASADTKPLFAATFPDSQGQTQAFSQWQGKVLVVNFWATWCPPCREEMPELSRLQEKYRASGLAIIGIATDDVDKMREFAQQNPVAYPLLAGDFEATNLATSLGNVKNILPYTVAIGRDGKVIASYLGRLDMGVVEQTLQPLLSISR
jgi:thiol-disulfide isomerase/thioredoxin